MVAANIAATLFVAVAFFGVGFGVPWRGAAEALGIAFLFSLTIGSLCAIFIPRISPRLWQYRFPINWLLLIACLFAFAMAGSTLTIGVLAGIGYIPSGQFAGCTNLMAVYFMGNAPALGDPDFDATSNATVYYLPGTTGWGPTFGGRPTAPWVLPRPLILTHDLRFGVQSNRLSFVISWATNVPVVVEASASLTNPGWSPISTNTLIGGTSSFSDPEWTNHPSRFYRLRGL